MGDTLVLSSLSKTWIFDLDGTLLKHNGYKISFVNRHFEGLFEEIIFASTNAEKISIMDDYAIANGLNHNQIGIVEDTYPVVLKANDNGYAATHISEIICNL